MSENLNIKKPFYKEWWGLLLVIAFFPILIPYIVWINKSMSKWIKIAISVFCLLIIVFSIFATKNANKQKNDDLELKNLHSIEFLKETLINMYDNEFELLLNGKLNKEYFKNEEYNKLFLTKLQENASSRSLFIEERKNEEKMKLEEEAKKEKKEKIEKHFSSWDGSHLELTKYIKSIMNDPSSYEHVETKYWDMGDHLIVLTSFRGKNAFGGLVKNNIKAKVGFDGKIISIIE